MSFINDLINVFFPDTTQPTAIILLSDPSLTLGKTATVTIKFSEAIKGFALSDLTVENGVLSNLTSRDSITWNAIFTPTVGVTDKTNSISLQKNSYTDLAGNAGKAASSANYTVDTSAPTAIITLSDNALIVGKTATVTFSFSEAVKGFDLSDLKAENGILSNLVTSDSITWKAIFTPTAGVTDTTNSISLLKNSYTDLAGNAGNAGKVASSANYTVDTSAPTATISLSDDALMAGETATVTFSFSEAVKGFDLSHLKAENGILSNLTTSDSITWKAIFTPTAGVTDNTNSISIQKNSYTDLAGNVGKGVISANYTVKPVIDNFAETPSLSVTSTGNGLHQVKVNINSSLTDTDGSEKLSLFLENIPAGVTVTGAHLVNGHYLIDTPTNVILNLSTNTNSAFTVSVDAIATESFNGATAHKVEQLAVKENNFAYNFERTGQNMWGTGDAANLQMDKFFGINNTIHQSSGLFSGSYETYKLGFESVLSIQSGTINAHLPYDFSFDSIYDLTTGSLAITPHATLNKAYFETLSPQLKYDLNLIAEVDAHIHAGASLGWLGNVDIFTKDYKVNGDKNLVHFDNSNLITKIPLPLDFGSLTIAAPMLNTTGLIDSPIDTSVTSSGTSNDFLNLNIDVDKIMTYLIGLPLKFDFSDTSGEYIKYSMGINLLDAGITGALKFIQQFQMDVKNLSGTLNFENHTINNLNFDQTTTILDASTLDVNHDNVIDYNALITPHADMSNNTDLGASLGYNITALSAHASATAYVDLGWLGSVSASVNESIGPLVQLTGTSNTSVDLFNNSFDMGFAAHGFALSA